MVRYFSWLPKKLPDARTVGVNGTCALDPEWLAEIAGRHPAFRGIALSGRHCGVTSHAIVGYVFRIYIGDAMAVLWPRTARKVSAVTSPFNPEFRPQNVIFGRESP